MAYIIIYDIDTMYPLYTAEETNLVKKEFFEAQGLNCFISEDGDIHQKYVENNSLKPIEQINITANGIENPISTGINLGEEVTIEGYPEGSKLLVDNVEYETDDIIVLEPEEKGIYKITIVCKPKYYDYKLEVVVL